jgi:hypothetical protein
MRSLALLVCLSACGRLGFDDAVRPIDAALPLPPLTWTAEASGTNVHLHDIELTPDGYYVAGIGVIVFSTGNGAWTLQSIPSTTAFYGVGSFGRELYAVGNVEGTGHAIMHSTGDGTWTLQPNTIASVLNEVWLAAPDDIYAVGYQGTIVHSTGNGVWTSQPSGVSTRLLDIWGSGPNDIYAVGDGGVVLHSTGDGTWTKQMAPTLNTFVGVWGRSASDVYAVGHGATILQSSGDGTWSRRESGVGVDLYGVRGVGSELFVAGAGSTILHSTDGVMWQAQELGGGATMLEMFAGRGPGDIVVVGDPGVIMRATR